MLHYQQLGLLFRDDEYFIPREIEVPADLTQVTFLQKVDLESQVRQRSNLIQKMENDRVSLYAFIWKTLLESSQTLLMREAEWQTAGMNQTIETMVNYQSDSSWKPREHDDSTSDPWRN